MKTAIIVDLDGTLFFVGDRSYFDARYADKTDRVNLPVAEVVKLFKENGYKIIFISGSYDDAREARKNQLKNTFGWIDTKDYDLYLRKVGDYRKDTIFKEEVYKNHVEGRYKILFVLEDRNRMVDFYRNDLKIPCFQVNSETDNKK